MILPIKRLQRWAKKFLIFNLGLCFVYFYCEYFIYYITQCQCLWPGLKTSTENIAPVYAMIIADTHLLGSKNGHWFDKWRREWQMERSFQTAMTLHNPDVVFVLGDLFDEGKWCSNDEFNDYVERFNKMFHVPNNTKLYTVIGNHDIGFHYRTNGYLLRRFAKRFNSSSVEVISIRGNHFVLINSIAMEGDGCHMCSAAMEKIDIISNLLKCTRKSSACKGNEVLPDGYSRPIIMQHYPLFRDSDSMCTGSDAAPESERSKLFEERWDCLSRESTSHLVERLKPRLVFGGHTHHGCYLQHKMSGVNFIEYSVPSFSWRNRLNPKYMLATISPREFKVYKCSMPTELTMITSAIVLVVLLIIYLYNYERFHKYLYHLKRSSLFKQN